MTRRARLAAETSERIAAATEALLVEGTLAACTLQAIADRAEVTPQTVLRHMGSRDGCFAAVRDRLSVRIDAERGHTFPGDVDAALIGLLNHYESEGRLILQLLAQEAHEPIAREAVLAGRAYHRAWVERCFGPLLIAPDPCVIDALVAATDLYAWRLLRLDLGRSPEHTRAVLERIVRSILETS